MQQQTGGISIVTLAVGLFGPLAGEYAAIVLCSLVGALWALRSEPIAGTGWSATARGALFLLRIVGTACVLTGGLSWWLESRYAVPAHHGLAWVALAIGAGGGKWHQLPEIVWKHLTSPFRSRNAE